MTRPSRIVIAAIFAVSASGCDPIAGITLRQSLTPSPKIDCVQNALASSPLIGRVKQERFVGEGVGYSMTLMLRDSEPLRGPMPPALDLAVLQGDTTELRLNVSYFGAMDINTRQEQRLISIAVPIARAVRDACAPTSPPPSSCDVRKFGRGRSCAMAG